MSTYADGVNVDIEDPIEPKDAPALTALIASLAKYSFYLFYFVFLPTYFLSFANALSQILPR